MTKRRGSAAGGRRPAARGRAPLGEVAFQMLCRAIHEGIYRPGDRLREEEVADRLQISRTPVREAFGRLLTKRLVEPSGARGLVVRGLTEAEVVELYALREILEGAAARLASLQASQLEIDDLRDLEEAIEARADDPAELGRLNRMFHGAIFRSAHNRYLDRALEDLQDFIGLLGPTTFGLAGRADLAAGEHRAIVAAIVARRPDEAEAHARHHIREALRARMKLLRA